MYTYKTMKLWLSEQEVIELTKKKTRPAQLRVLKSMGYSVRMRPDNSFIVPTDQFQAGPENQPSTPAFNFSALNNGQAA